MIFIILCLISIILILIAFFLQRRNLSLSTHLSELRQNSIDYYRTQSRTPTQQHFNFIKDVDEVIFGFRQFYNHYRIVLRKNGAQYSDLKRMQIINEDLVEELGNLVQINYDLKLQVDQLQERNDELEYAINLESISMLEKYQAQGKLFSAINNVRRSLTRILNPA